MLSNKHLFVIANNNKQKLSSHNRVLVCQTHMLSLLLQYICMDTCYPLLDLGLPKLNIRN